MIRFTSRPGRLIGVVAIVLGLVITTATAALAVDLVKSGKSVTAVKTITSDAFNQTTSSTFSNMPGMSTTITVPANQKALLIITFSGETNCLGNANGVCLIRVMVDNNAAPPGEIVFDSVGRTVPFQQDPVFSYQSNSMQFVAGPLNAGQHQVTVQWRMSDPSATNGFTMNQRTLTILRSKV